MSGIVIGTNVIRLDEPCWRLCELHMQSPDSRGFRRYQIFYVVRADRLAEFRRDLGLAAQFKGVEEFRLLGGAVDEETGRIWIEHTVGELVDIADYFRAGLHRPPQLQPDDLIAGYHDEMDKRRRGRRGRKAFGPALSVQGR